MNISNIINVISVDHNTDVKFIYSYPDTPEGNEEANKKFAELAKMEGADNDDMAGYINDGRYVNGYNGRSIQMLQSE